MERFTAFVFSRFLGLQGTPGHLLHGMRQHRFEHRRSGRPAVLWIPVDGGHSHNMGSSIPDERGSRIASGQPKLPAIHYSLCTLCTSWEWEFVNETCKLAEYRDDVAITSPTVSQYLATWEQTPLQAQWLRTKMSVCLKIHHVTTTTK